jgi:ring-1,2-phenylacetyl-CoA epoxidase subunit PaaC
VARLGDGTDLSHERMQAALDALWPLTEELFKPDANALAGLEPAAIDPVIGTVLAAAGLQRPRGAPLGTVSGRGGRDGVHTEAMGYILAELQSVARAYPDATW